MNYRRKIMLFLQIIIDNYKQNSKKIVMFIYCVIKSSKKKKGISIQILFSNKLTINFSR